MQGGGDISVQQLAVDGSHDKRIASITLDPARATSKPSSSID